jgi:uncharacterized membrane protein
VSGPRLAEQLLSTEERGRVRAAIAEVELRTNAEVRVHLDDHCREDEVLDHAAFVFEELAMHRTAQRNGVLIYVSVADHRMAVIGDVAVNERLGDDHWAQVLNVILLHFRQGRYADGLCAGVAHLGQALEPHFPRQMMDRNELGDDITFG